MRRALGLLAAAVTVVAGCGGEDDPLAELRAADGVREVREDAGTEGLVVTVEPRTGPAAIAAAVEAVPREVRRATFRDGRAELVLAGAAARRQASSSAAALAALARVRSPARRIAVEATGGAPRVRADVDGPAQAAPLAREVVALVGPERLRGDAVRDVVVQQAGTEARDAFTVVLRLSGTPADAPKLAALDAVEALAAREPRLTAVGPGVDLRVTAADVDDAGAAWAQAAGALDGAARGDVDLSVAVGDAPVVGGPADTSPRRALALLRAFGDRVVAPYARTDLSTVRARLAEPRTNRATVADAARAARCAAAAGAERLEVQWPAGDDVEWLGAVPGIDATSASVADTPAGVLRVLPAIRRAHAARFPAIRWSRPAPGRLARLELGRPELVDELEDEESGGGSGSVLGGRARSRRLARTIRAIGWPGAARFELPVGKGTCAGERSSTVVEVVSTAAGRAKSVDARYGCADAELVRAFRDTWDDTASR